MQKKKLVKVPKNDPRKGIIKVPRKGRKSRHLA